MERQKPVNSVQHNDEYSKALIESYSQWMGGTGFQQSEPIAIEEDGIPAEQKQGSGEGGGEFETPIGKVPAVEKDESTSIPELQKKGGEDNFTIKDPKANAGLPDPAVNLRIGAGVKQSHGASIRDVTKVAAEEVEHVVEKEECCKKCGSKDHVTNECKATKEEVETYQWDVVNEALEILGELTESKYHVRGAKLSDLKERTETTTQRLFKYSKRLQEKKAAKDYDGDGKVESGKDEYFGSKDKAIKKAMGKKGKK